MLVFEIIIRPTRISEAYINTCILLYLICKRFQFEDYFFFKALIFLQLVKSWRRKSEKEEEASIGFFLFFSLVNFI